MRFLKHPWFRKRMDSKLEPGMGPVTEEVDCMACIASLLEGGPTMPMKMTRDLYTGITHVILMFIRIDLEYRACNVRWDFDTEVWRLVPNAWTPK